MLRRLGPVEELSPAAVDLLIRIYTSEDRLDKAELVWRFAKGHGQIEGDTYDPALYKLGKQPEPAAAPAEAEAAAPPVEETPAPEELAAEGEADRPFGRADRPGDRAGEPPSAAKTTGSFLDEPLSPGSSDFLSAEAGGTAAPAPSRPAAPPLGSVAPSPPVTETEFEDNQRWPPALVSAILAGVVLLVIAAVIMARGCDSTASVGSTSMPTSTFTSQAAAPWSVAGTVATRTSGAPGVDAMLVSPRAFLPVRHAMHGTPTASRFLSVVGSTTG